MTAVAQREVIIVERGNTVRLPDNLAEHFTSHMLAAGSVNLHAVAGGSGPALLLIGGWPQTWYTWRAIMPHLLSEGFSVIAVDPRGTGTSDIVASDDSGSYYDITTVSDELVAMMNALGHERFCVAGHDIGMWIGFAMAADHADRVKQLAVADAMIPGVTPSPQLFGPAARNNRSWHFAFNRAPDEIQQALLSKGGARAYLEWQFKTKAAFPGAVDPGAVEQFVQAYIPPLRLRAGFDYYRAIDQTMRDNESRLTRKLTMPILAIGGEKAAGASVAATMERVSDKVASHVLAGVGHYVTEEAPADMASLLCNFFAR